MLYVACVVIKLCFVRTTFGGGVHINTWWRRPCGCSSGASNNFFKGNKMRKAPYRAGADVDNEQNIVPSNTQRTASDHYISKLTDIFRNIALSGCISTMPF